MTNRMDRVRSLFDSLEIDALLVSNAANRIYLTGWSADDHSADASSGVVIVTRTDAMLFVSPTNLPWAAAEASGIKIAPWQRPWTASIAAAAQSADLSRIGIEDHVLTFASYRSLADAMRGITMVPVGTAVDRLRGVKDAEEIAKLERSLRLTDATMEELIRTVTPEMTERQAAALADRIMRDLGADGAAFDTIVAAGTHAARPHHRPSDRVLGEGVPIIIDLGARLDGYNGDLTRTVWFGTPEDRLIAVYNAVSQAQGIALASLRAGAVGGESDRLARKSLTAAGFGDGIIHSLGHGLGIRVHESPSLLTGVSDPLRAGEVVTVEPGLYFADWGGVRIEDVVLIGDEGCRLLTAASKFATR